MSLQKPFSTKSLSDSFAPPNFASFHRWTKRCLARKYDQLYNASKFTNLLPEHFDKPTFFGFITNHNYWTFQDKAIFEAVPFSLAGVPDCSNWFMLLSFVYVYDEYRSMNIGSELVRILTTISENTSCAIGLISCPFSFTKDGFRSYSVCTADDVWHLREIGTNPSSNLLANTDSQDCLNRFYRRHGFINMCLHHDVGGHKRRWAGIPFENHFVFLPNCLSAGKLNHFKQRLDRGNCCFCGQKNLLI